jgi:hypothetical protein
MSRDIYLKIIFKSKNTHPVKSEPIAAFVYDYKLNKSKYFNFSHPDIFDTYDWDSFKTAIKGCRIFVINKKKYLYHLYGYDLVDVNSITFSNDGIIIDEVESDTLKSYQSVNGYNYIIPFSLHQLNFDEEVASIKSINNHKFDEYSYRFFNDLLCDTLYEVEKNGLKLDLDVFQRYYPDKKYKDFAYTQYNIFNPTGRPSNNYDNINYVALNKDDGRRKSFISRYEDGYYLLVDFVGFHPYIVSDLISYNVPDDETIYEHLAKYYYKISDVTKSHIASAKKLTMINLYGQINDEYLDIEFFRKTENLKTDYWNSFMRNGYIESPLYRRRITSKHIKSPNKNKLFSYIIQACETEYGIDSLKKCINFVCDKKIDPVLYIYDSVLFDVDNSVSEEHIKDLVTIFKSNRFKVKTYIGKNYNDVIET